MNDWIQTLIVRMFLSKGGPLAINLISALAAYASVQASKYIPDADKLITPELVAGFTFLAVSELVSMLPAKILKTYGKQIQTVLNDAGASLKVDGVVLVKTAAAVTDKAK